MSATAVRPRPKTSSAGGRKKKKKAGGAGILRWWPVALGVVLALLVERIAATVAIAVPDASRFVLPLPYLVKGHSFGLPASAAENISEFATYAQFPLYGLLLVVLAARMRFRPALVVLLGLHSIAFVVAAFMLRG